MSCLLRRNSNKQGLQDLLRVTAQRSVEDAEEVERERRRRARDAHRRLSCGSGSADPPQEDRTTVDHETAPDHETTPDHGTAVHDLYSREPKACQSASLEEDEGFSDGTKRRERQRRHHLRGDAEEEEVVKVRRQQWQDEPEAVEKERGGMNRREEKERVEEETTAVARRPDTKEVHNREATVSYTSTKVFHQKEVSHNNGNTANQEVTSHINMKTKAPIRAVIPQREPGESEATLEREPDELEAILEREQRLEKASQEPEQLRQKQQEEDQELEELKKRREERRRAREEDERRREGREEEERRRMKEVIDRRRIEAADRLKMLNCSSPDEEETFSPVSPKISQRTESLNRSLKKSNSFKKTQPPVLLSRFDDRLEQYSHAIENSQEVRAAKLAVSEIPNAPEAVASRKNLFEWGENWSHSPTKGAPCKDTDGLKVGVADLITQWVKGGPDASGKTPPSRPAEVKPGDVMQKKNLWEVIGDTGRRGGGARGTCSKRYKYVVTGHGKYEKLCVDNDNGDRSHNY